MANRDLTTERWLRDLVVYLKKLERKDGRVSHLCSMEHGFEDWLKFEMAALLCREPWLYRLPDPASDQRPPDEVGLEWRATLTGWTRSKKTGRRTRKRKLVDLWAAPSRGLPERPPTSWHFVELKIAFNNANAGKQFASWRSDFLALRTIDGNRADQKPSSVASIMFGIGFPEAAFAAASRRVRSGIDVDPIALRVPTESEPLRIHALIEAVQ